MPGHSLSLHDLLRSRLHFAAGQALAFAGRVPAAITSFRSAIGHDPEYVNAWRNFAFLLAQSGQTDAAIEAFRSTLALDAADHASRFNLGFTLHRQGQLEAATLEFEAVVAAVPSNDRAWFGLGLCRKGLGRLEDSIVALKEAARLQYFSPQAGYELAIAYHRHGDREALKAEYERVKGFDPAYAERIRSETGLS